MEHCIYETDDEYKAKMVVNILKKNKILTFSKNMGIQNLFGDSKLFVGSDLIVGEIKIYVKEGDIGKAKQIINRIPFLKKEIKTIDNDEIKKKTYIMQRALVFSVATLFIIPFFFNLEYLIYCFKNNSRVRYILLVINILYMLLSIVFCIKSFEYTKMIWKWNLFFTLAFSIGKGIELHNKKSKLKYLMIIPIILLILSYNIAYQMYGIQLFGYNI
ncbi:hypothetical protein FACS1894130_10410 [Spirochaetia bacterium]|nr:hypothetical protein FACS1894130_10410 [Spirochaetia bacterium]